MIFLPFGHSNSGTLTLSLSILLQNLNLVSILQQKRHRSNIISLVLADLLVHSEVLNIDPGALNRLAEDHPTIAGIGNIGILHTVVGNIF